MEFISEKSGERLDKFLAGHLTKFSRSQFQRFIKSGAVKVGGIPVEKPAYRLKKGERVLILEEKIFEFSAKGGSASGGKIEPEPEIPLNIVYEDNDIAVINKQPGLLVHPTLSQRRHTLVNALVARYPEIIGVGDPSTSSGQVSPFRPGIVHRLDKDTSGLLIVAKTQKAFQFIKEQFLKRTIVKKYLALVEGAPKEKRGIISYSIRPSKRNRLKKVAIRKPGAGAEKPIRAAETYYQVKKVYEVPPHKIALLEVSPKTGRTHQIRVHLAAIGHPIVGDKLYGSRKRKEERGKRKELELKRQMLHAYSLRFTAPSGRRLELEAGLPEDMEEVIRKTTK